MLLKAAFIVLAVWLVGVLGLYEAGSRVHVLLLVGLMMLLLEPSELVMQPCITNISRSDKR